MSDDELEKLAAEMQNMSPSETARKRGMEAAMAAFTVEFAQESVADTQAETAKEKNSTLSQGLTDAPRPTGQSPLAERAQTLGRETMTRFSNVMNNFKFTPRAAMMGGSCMAALMVSMVFFDAGQFGKAPTIITEVPSQIAADEPQHVEPRVVEPVIAPPAKPKAPVAPKAVASADANIGQSSDTQTEEFDEVIVTTSKAVAPPQDRIASVEGAMPQFEAPKVESGRPSFPVIPRPPAPINSISELLAIHSNNQARLQAAMPPSVKNQYAGTPSLTNVPSISENETSQTQKIDGLTFVEERTKPTLPQTVQRQVLVAPPKYYLRDEDGNVVREFASRDEFEIYKANIPTSVEETPVSTFSVDVDTASYSFLRASLNRGQLPPRSSIRLEEMINYFPYDYEAPKSADEPFKANVTVTPNPWNADTKLMHIGIKGYVPPAAERPRSNIVLLIDTSGSMRQANKLPLLINSFKLLLNTLGDDDTVSIVTYAGSAGTVLEPTPASDKQKIKEALTRLQAGGSTAGAAGLELAYQKAQESFDDEGVNRVILATDGDFNVGFSSPDEMKNFISKKRETGIFLSVLGFGQGNYKDDLMQSLAQNGNGVAAYIDTLAEANKVLADEAGSALFTIAKDVKIQVEFNPDTISEYRLIGYETRALKRQDFNNDKVDAGEIGAGHTVTAIYELTPVGSPAKVIDPLRYVNSKTSSIGSNEFAFVKIRHKLPNADKSTLQTFPIGPKQERSLRRSSKDMRFAAAVAAVGQKLRGDTQLEDFSYDEAIKLASGAKGKDEHGYRAEFIQMVRLAKSIDE